MLYKKSKNEIRNKSLSILMLTLVLSSVLFLQCQAQNSKPNKNIELYTFGQPDTVYVETENGDLKIVITERQPIEIYKKVDKMPEYPGGEERLMEYLIKNIKYPQEAKDKKIEGRVLVEFVVDEAGQVIDPKILKGIPNGDALNKEARRAIDKMPNWVPARHKGKDVATKYILPVVFKL